MKILKVIHGYPYRYNAGSEVYSQTLCHELDRLHHKVVVFSREENCYKQEYSVNWETDPQVSSIRLCLINMAHGKDGYQHPAVDHVFSHLIDQFHPDVVHIGHLNHLSTSVIREAHRRQIPIVFTLHDFWLMCPRGQFLQGINSKSENLYPICDSQEDKKCAKECYWRYFGSQESCEDLTYWTNWVKRRMDHIREMASMVDLYISPSKYLMDRFINEFGMDSSKMVYLDYGFHLKRLEGRKRETEDSFVFGYIGTHKQAKGIHLLIEAFSQISKKARLRIWGSPLPPFTQSLQSFVKALGMEERVEWRGGYRNEKIVDDVFNHVDAIVVPSIWGENSPLVIHEALEAKVPIITADFGGMKEYVHHELNGLLFQHRNPQSLAEQMDRLLGDPALGHKISMKGYLQSPDGHIPNIEDHTKAILDLYKSILTKKNKHDKSRSLANHI
jgi:glycosyltransferase involved in cell wall biosynthesis